MIDRLDENEQRALMELLICLAKADGAVEAVEEEVLWDYADLVDVDFESLEGTYSLDELVPNFESPESKLIVLQELLRLSHLDGTVSKPEKETILSVAEKMNVPLSVVQELDEWVLEGLRWVIRGEEMLESKSKELSASA